MNDQLETRFLNRKNEHKVKKWVWTLEELVEPEGATSTTFAVHCQAYSEERLPEQMAAGAKSEEIVKMPLMSRNHTYGLNLVSGLGAGMDSSLSQPRNHQYWHAMRLSGGKGYPHA